MKDRYNLRNCACGKLSWNLLWLLLFIAGMGVFLIGMPKYIDDCWYLWLFGDWLFANGVRYPTDGVNLAVSGIPWTEIWDTICFHYNQDNGRLGNILVVFFILLPKWVGSSLCLLAWIYVVVRSCSFCGIKISKSALVPVALALWYMLMPWQNHMGSLVFQFNYIIPSAISVYILNILFNPMGNIISSLRKWRIAGIFAVGLILGAWNEALSLPFLAGTVIVCLFYRPFRNRYVYACIAGMVMGILWLLLAPGFAVRYATIDHSYATGFVSVLKRFAKIVSMHPSAVVLVVTELWIAVRKGFKRLAMSPVVCLVSVSALFSITLSFITTGMPRSAWWSDMISVIGILYLLQKNYGSYWNRYRGSSIFIGMFLMTVTGLSLVLTDIFVVKAASECRTVIDSYLDNPQGNVYNDWLSDIDDPILMLSKFDTYPEGYLSLYPSWHLNKNDMTSGRINIVPERLKAITPIEGEALPGEGCVRRVDNFYVIETDSVITGHGKVDLCLDNGRIVDASVIIVPFVSGYDQRKYNNMIIYDRKIERLFHEIKSIGKYKDNG